MTTSVDQFYHRAVNRYCNLPRISPQEAFELHHGAVDLISGIATLRRLAGRLGRQEISRLVQTMAWKMMINQPDEAYEVARLAAGVVDSLDGKAVGGALAVGGGSVE